MGLNLAETHGWIVSELAAGRPIRQSMHRLIDRCAAVRPHPDWHTLRELPYDELSPLASWIERPLRDEPPTVPLRGLWFGLFNPVYDRQAVADLYLCGSDRFDPNPTDNAWAVGPVWWPEERYAHSEILASIYRVAYGGKGGLENDAEFPLCLGYGAFAVRELLNGIDPTLILGSVGAVGVAVGFDSGDFVLLGKFTESGLLPF